MSGDLHFWPPDCVAMAHGGSHVPTRSRAAADEMGFRTGGRGLLVFEHLFHSAAELRLASPDDARSGTAPDLLSEEDAVEPAGRFLRSPLACLSGPLTAPRICAVELQGAHETRTACSSRPDGARPVPGGHAEMKTVDVTAVAPSKPTG